LDNLDQSPPGPRRLLVSSEGGDREDDERRKFETPEVIGDSGAVISLKSVNLNSPTYRNEENNALYSKLSRDLNKLAEFQGSDYADTKIPGDAIKSRTLRIIVPNGGTAAQQEAMRRIVELGRQRGVTVDIIIYP
jgi:hypothetical protein